MKKIAIFSLVLTFALGLSSGSAFAKNTAPDLPEIDGVYAVPGHLNLKLRVIVHKAKVPPMPVPSLVCDLTDPVSTQVTPDYGYKLPANWTYYLNSQSAPGTIGSANAENLTTNAFRTWTDVVPEVNIIDNGSTTKNKAAYDGKNIITWGRASGSALGITYIWYNTNTKFITELDTIMNLKFTWYWSDPNEWTIKTNSAGTTCAYAGVYDAQDIMTHELGHWFGMDDVYDAKYSANTMFGYGGKGQTFADTLTTGDIIGVQALYN